MTTHYVHLSPGRIEAIREQHVHTRLDPNVIDCFICELLLDHDRVADLMGQTKEALRRCVLALNTHEWDELLEERVG